MCTIKKINYYFIILISLNIFECCNTKSLEKNIVSNWFQKKVIFPSKYYLIQNGDTVNNISINNQFTIFTYIDSVDCVDCRLKLREWKTFLSTIQKDINFVMVINSKNVDRIISQTNYDRFTYPICIDIFGDFAKLNSFPNEIEYKTFLLDANNKVLLVGNPLFKPNLENLYKKIINN